MGKEFDVVALGELLIDFTQNGISVQILAFFAHIFFLIQGIIPLS